MKKIFLVFLILSTYTISAQVITGTVTDDELESLPSVNIYVDGTSYSASTDLNGVYTMVLSEGTHRVTFSFIGYTPEVKTVTLKTGETQNINIKLKSESIYTDEVVVVGYGVQRRREITGSIESIDGKEIGNIPVPSFEAALQGQAAGVQVSTGSGLAGSGSLIRIRGVASISAGGDPLYVIDGIPISQDQFLRGNSGALNNNPLANINPQDIESIEILKDAAATGIYGSRGANGVVLITTKRAKKKGLSFDFTTRFGVSTPASVPDMLNTEEYLQLRQEAWENDGGTGYVWLPNYSAESDAASVREAAYLEASQYDTDWVDETLGTGFKQMYSLSANKGTDKVKAFFNFTYDDNESFFKGNSYERISGRANVDFEVTKKFKINFSQSISRGQNTKVDAAWSGGLGSAMSTALPIYPVLEESAYHENDIDRGDYFLLDGQIPNLVAYRENREWFTTENRSITNIGLNWEPIKNLYIRATGSYDYLDIKEDVYRNQNIVELRDSTYTGTGNANRYVTWVNNYNTNVTANYLVNKSEKHKWNFLLGSEYQRSKSLSGDSYFGNATTTALSDDFDSEATAVNRNNAVRWSFISYFGRVNYSYNNRLYAQLTNRVDGSSIFGANSRYGWFPSASVGYVLSELDFLKNNKTINFLKLRSSYGITGNADIDKNARFPLYEDSNASYNGQTIIYPTQLGNENLQWETSNVFDLALEAGLWKDRVTVEMAYYNKRSTDVLMQVQVSPSTGFSNFWDNAAEVLNRGWELTLRSNNIVKKNFQWTSNMNFARNYNEIVNIGNYTPDAVSGGTNDTRVIVGSPIGSFMLVPFSHVDSETGKPVFLDLDGNQTFDYDFKNGRAYVGDGLPDVIMGLNNTFTYKNWDLTALINVSLGAQIFDSSGKRQMGLMTDWNMRTDILDRWTQPGDNAMYPQLTFDETKYGFDPGDNAPWFNTSLYVYDADYARLKRLVLGYNVPAFKIRNKNITGMRVAFSATNVFTVTNFPGLDPEIVRDFENPQDRNLSGNITYLTPPQERSYSVQINLTF